MIRVSTFQELLANEHSLGLYCVECNRWGTADLAGLVNGGRGNSVVTDAKFRCQDCGSIVQKQLRPPTPTLGRVARYI